MKVTALAITLMAALNAASAQEQGPHQEPTQSAAGVDAPTAAAPKDQSMHGMDMSHGKHDMSSKAMDGMQMSPSSPATPASASSGKPPPTPHDTANQKMAAGA